jgi:Ca-activated chloride channel homolog
MGGFEHPNLLWIALAATIGLSLFFWWAWRKKQRLIAQFVRSRLFANLTLGISSGRQKARLALLVGAVALVIIALARPQWGYDWEEARQRGLDVVVAIDTSRSMLAADIPPSRLARAKLAALDLKRLARADRVGLVAFAGSAFLQCPLSFDDEAFRQSVNALDVGIIPVGGSAIAEAIETARAAFKEKNDNYKVLVLFTDGEDNDGRAAETAKSAAKDGMRIFTIGIGTANGELLKITDAKGRTDYVRDDQGNVIKSRLNEQLLQEIARASQGFYMLLSGANTMELLYERGLAPLPKTEHTARRIKRFHERYQWLLGAAVVLLCVEMLLPERKRARRAATAVPSATAMKAAVLFVAVMLPGTAFGSAASALRQYQGGKYKSALRGYEELLRERPNEPKLHYNAGAAAFQMRDYERAIKHFGSALSAQDLALQQRALYNLGNAYFRSGEATTEPQETVKQWEESLKSYDSARQLDPNDADAKYNYEVVKKRLEELKQQQQQQQKDQNQQDKSDQDQDKQDQQKQDKQDQKDQKDEKSKEDQQQQQEQQEKKDQQQQQQEQEKKAQQQQQQKPSDKQDQSQEKKPEEGKERKDEKQGNEGAAQQPFQMTPEQAQRLLEAVKNDEKVMIFTPQQKTNRNNRVLKDW